MIGEDEVPPVAEEAPAPEPQPRAWTICLIDEGPDAKIPGQLIGYETEMAIDEPPRRPGKFTAPRGTSSPRSSSR